MRVLVTAMKPEAPMPARKRRTAMTCQLPERPLRPAGMEYRSMAEAMTGFLPRRSAAIPMTNPPTNMPPSQALSRSPVLPGGRESSCVRGLRTKEMRPEFMASSIQPRKQAARMM